MIAIVVAVARNGVIGRDGGLPWHLPADLRRFRELTLGKPIVMGRATHESIGRPLPGRTNIVLTRDRAYRRDGIVVIHSPEEAIGAGEDAMIVGGAEVYRAFLPSTGRIHLTVVECEPDGATRFPFDGSRWRVVETVRVPADERNPITHRYHRLERDDAGVELIEVVGRE